MRMRTHNFISALPHDIIIMPAWNCSDGVHGRCGSRELFVCSLQRISPGDPATGSVR